MPAGSAVGGERCRVPSVLKHVLIVDGEIRSTALLEQHLHAEGYRVGLASSGWKALAKCEVESPDVLVLDAKLPDMDGFELCERLRNDPFLLDIPIIMLTEPDDEMAREYAWQMVEFAGGDFFLAKPVDTSVMLKLLDNLTTEPIGPFDPAPKRFPTHVVWPTRQLAPAAVIL